MQKYQLLFLTCISVSVARAQEFYEPFRYTEILQCPFDPESTVEWPENWSVYHTKNDLWNGEVDSSWCIPVELFISGFARRIYLNAEDIDGERPVFLRYRNFEISTVLLPENMLYNFETYVRMHNDASLKLGTQDNQKPGVLLVVDIPAEDTSGRSVRNRFYEFQDSTDWILSSSCFASEKFTDQTIKDIVITLPIRHVQAKGRVVEIYNVFLMPAYYYDILTLHLIDPQWWHDTSYVVPVEALGSSPYYNFSYLLPYTLPGYPSSSNISHYDLGPAVPSDTAQTITVVVGEEMSLVPQLFTALRGDLVSATDTIRHRVELLNDGGNLCIYYVELTFGDHTGYVHKKGTIDLGSKESCMMFKTGASLEIMENAHLNFGENGAGFLALKEGSRMILRENAEMVIRNNCVLQLSPVPDQPNPVVYLYPGSKLSFSQTASLQAWGSDQLRLKVMMHGGSIDTHALSTAERELIEFEYPALPGWTDNEELILIKDRSGSLLNVYVKTDDTFDATFLITDLTGRIVCQQRLTLDSGNFYHSIEIGQLPSGWYTAALQTQDRWLTASFTHQ